MFSLTHLRGRIAAVGGVVVLLLAGGVWLAVSHSSAGRAAADGQPAARPSASVAAGPLELLSSIPAGNATEVSGMTSVQVHFSAPLAADSPLPTITPAVQGSWQGAGTKTLTFLPTAAFGQLTQVTVQVPGGPQGVRSTQGSLLATTVTYQFKTGTYQTGRLDQLLAQLGYLPLTWAPDPGVAVPAATDAAGQLNAAYDPPQGSFTWQTGYPSQLQQFWQDGAADSQIVKGAVMAFEADQGLALDGIAGAQVWAALLKAVAAGQDNTHGYTYAIADESNPETLTIWHDGQVVQKSDANTGIDAAPTTLGTAPVYLRYRYQIMRGTNPDGTKYADPVQYVAYFRAGEAVHYFPRGSYGWPQSLGCVELDLTDAAQAWPYLSYGSLVTVERGSLTPPSSPTA